ncbi:hypothetical protein [Catenuloplanes japonicus]|uniref:hypothetical protein n=1 Tax=Catenuloplanes japonicus TaxID=33876 RepID=UPI000523F946|nr:hypothetical protein [Catenuloplanes japonicus]
MIDSLRDRYHDLPAPVRDCCHAFAVHPGLEPGLPVLAAVLATDESSTGRYIGQLIDAGLVQPEPGGGRFRMRSQALRHATVDIHADPPRERLLTARLSDWYLARTLAASTVVAPFRTPDPVPAACPDRCAAGLATAADALTWLHAERANLLALARARKDDDPHMVWSLLDAMRVLFEVHGFTDDRLEASVMALDCAEKAGDPARISHAWRRADWA